MKAAVVIIIIIVIGYVAFLGYQGRETANLNNQAVQLMDEGRYGEAAALLEKARRGDPGNASIMKNLVEAYEQQGDLTGAAAVYRDLISRSSNPSPEDQARLAQLEEEGALLERARQRVARMKAQGWQDDGNSIDQTLAAADASWNVGNWQHAITLYERVLFKDPTDTGILRRIEEIEQGQQSGALK